MIKHIFDEAKQCTNHTQTKLENGDCCQTEKTTYTHSWYNLFKEDNAKCCQEIEEKK